MTARILTEADRRRESAANASQRTIKCTKCGEWIRYTNGSHGTDDDRVTVLGKKPHDDRRFVVCPGCKHERVIALGYLR